MAKCNVCGELTFAITTCALCSAGNKPRWLTINKFKNEIADRHRLPAPQIFAQEWAAGLVKTRVSDLFSSLGGLPGHFIQIQTEVNRTRNGDFFVRNQQTTEKGKELYTLIGNSIISAAESANFNFNEKVLEFPGDFPWLKISKANMILKITWGKNK